MEWAPSGVRSTPHDGARQPAATLPSKGYASGTKHTTPIHSSNLYEPYMYSICTRTCSKFHFSQVAKLVEQVPKRCGNLHFDESIIPRNCYESDGVCTMQCASGYHYVEGNFELTCLPEGEWSGQPLGT